MLESLCFTYVYCGKNWTSVLWGLQDYNTFLLPQLPCYTLAIWNWLISHNWNFVFLDQHLPFPRLSDLTSLHPLCCHESLYWRACVWCVFSICLSDLISQLDPVTADRVVKASGRKADRSAAPAGLLPSVLLLYTCPEGWLHFQSSVLSMTTHPRARAAVLRAAQEEQVFILFVPLNLTFSCCGSPSLLCVVSKWQVSVDLLPFIASDDQEELLHPCETDTNAFNPKKISQTSDSRG